MAAAMSSKAETRTDGLALPFLVLDVRRGSRVVLAIGELVHELKLGEDEHHRAEGAHVFWSFLKHLPRETHGQIDDEVDYPIARCAEAVVHKLRNRVPANV